MIVARYIAAQLLRGWLVAALVLAAVFWLLGFIQELDSIRQDYSAASVALYTSAIMPQQLLPLVPVMLLLGTILGLSGMERHSELTVISAAGVPRSILLKALAAPSLLLMVLLWTGMQYSFPALHQNAEEMRRDLRQEATQRVPPGGLWSRSGRRYIHLSRLDDTGHPGDIELFEFDREGRLQRAVSARRATVGPGRRWLLEDVQEKTGAASGLLQTRRLDTLEVDNLWSAEELPVLPLGVNSMRLEVLADYADYLMRNGRDDRVYRSTFWQRLAMPVTAVAMVLLGTVIAGGRRSSRAGVGLGLAVGTVIGIAFFLAAQILYALGDLLAFSPALVAFTPAAVLALIAGTLFLRLRW